VTASIRRLDLAFYSHRCGWSVNPVRARRAIINFLCGRLTSRKKCRQDEEERAWVAMQGACDAEAKKGGQRLEFWRFETAPVT